MLSKMRHSDGDHSLLVLRRSREYASFQEAGRDRMAHGAVAHAILKRVNYRPMQPCSMIDAFSMSAIALSDCAPTPHDFEILVVA